MTRALWVYGAIGFLIGYLFCTLSGSWGLH